VTGIEFWFNAADRLDTACRLVRKAAVGQGTRLVVTVDAEELEALDTALWQLGPTDFIAHCRADAPAELLAHSPVVLAPPQGSALPLHPLLINLAASVPQGFERFDRLIEFVGDDEAQRQAGRQRWRHYADRGYAITRKDLSGSAA